MQARPGPGFAFLSPGSGARLGGPPPRPPGHAPAGRPREIRIQAIFSLVPPTVSRQGKQKSGVLSIYFSM